MRVGAVLAAGLVLLAATGALVLSGSPIRVLERNSVASSAGAVAAQTAIASAHADTSACQREERLPRSTTAVRLSFEAAVGPSVTVTAREGASLLTSGTRGSGWTGAQVTVPVRRVSHGAANVTVCFALGQSSESVYLYGLRTRASTAASNASGALAGRIGIEYLAPGTRSWWSQTLSVARRLGLGRAPSGTWVALALILLMIAVAALAAALSLRELAGRQPADRPDRRPSRLRGGGPNRLPRQLGALRRVPGAAWACALVACVNAVGWSLLTPPFQVPEEPAHFAYVQQLAEAHRLPSSSAETYSPAEETALADLRHPYIQFVPSQGTISSAAQERRLEHDLSQPLSSRGTGDAGRAASEPPLYYALETIPYELGSSGTLLDQLELMRLLSAFFGGLTALFAFLFVREAAPGVPWAWTVGGLGVALAPLLGFMSGSVNPDAMLFAVSAALFYLLARAFRRGLAPKLAAAIGAATAVGLLTKLNFLGLVPGVLVGLIALALREPRERRRRACTALALALAVAASPALLYLAFRSLTDSSSLGFVSGSAATATRAASIGHELAYVWQLYLPRLPGMTNYFPGIFTTRQLWFDGLVGLYGWADTVFPGWVDDLALIPTALLALLCLRTLVVSRATLSTRAVELAVYAIMTVGVMVLVGIGSYANGRNGPFWEPRYLLPMLPLLGAVLALAARGAGRRWGPVAGTTIVVLLLAHDLFSQLLLISRYYG